MARVARSQEPECQSARIGQVSVEIRLRLQAKNIVLIRREICRRLWHIYQSIYLRISLRYREFIVINCLFIGINRVERYIGNIYINCSYS